MAAGVPARLCLQGGRSPGRMIRGCRGDHCPRATTPGGRSTPRSCTGSRAVPTPCLLPRAIPGGEEGAITRSMRPQCRASRGAASARPARRCVAVRAAVDVPELNKKFGEQLSPGMAAVPQGQGSGQARQWQAAGRAGAGSRALSPEPCGRAAHAAAGIDGSVSVVPGRGGLPTILLKHRCGSTAEVSTRQRRRGARPARCTLQCMHACTPPEHPDARRRSAPPTQRRAPPSDQPVHASDGAAAVRAGICARSPPDSGAVAAGPTATI
jgi:hypothetical protein